MMKDLTQRQREVLAFISEYIKTHTYPPTIREIADYFTISVKGAYDHVAALKKKGCIKGDKRSRTMEVIKQGQDRDADKMVEIPLLGTVAAGKPILAEENWDGTVKVHPSMLKKPGGYFALKVRGDSMEATGIMDGDMAIIEQQDSARNGDIVVAMLEDEAVTLKRFFKESTRVRLQPENPKYSPIYTQDVRILGRLALTFRSY
jgi:repressor LexA